MAISSRAILRVAAAAVATVFAGSEASALPGAATERGRGEAVSPQRDDAKKKTAMPPKHLAGVVRDDAGRAVAGATVVAGKYHGGESNHVVGMTGPDGHFELNAAGKSAELQYVLVYKEGLAPASLLRIPRANRPDEGEVAFELGRPAQFVGVVKDGEGRPVSRATVRVIHVRGPPARRRS